MEGCLLVYNVLIFKLLVKNLVFLLLICTAYSENLKKKTLGIEKF